MEHGATANGRQHSGRGIRRVHTGYRESTKDESIEYRPAQSGGRSRRRPSDSNGKRRGDVSIEARSRMPLSEGIGQQ